MKSLPKVNPNAVLESWNPPDLEAEATTPSKSARNEKVLAIFQNTDVNSADEPKQQINKKYTAWQPGFLDHQTEYSKKDEWSFIDVADTPFDKSWKTKSPSIFSARTSQREDFVSDNEVPMILERARLQAEEIILAAQAQSDDLLLQAQDEIDEQKKTGYQQGWTEAQTKAEDAVKAARKMFEEIEAWKTEFISGSEQILVEMLKDISRKMFGDGAKLDHQALHSNLNRILENARGLGPLKIFLNPNDAKLLDPYWSEQQMLILGEQVKIVPSSNVLPGGCLIKGNIGTVDARVETQLDTILNTFDQPESLIE